MLRGVEGLLVFKITPVAGEGKVIIAHQNLLPLFGDNIERGPENEGNQQDVDESQNCILAVSDDGMTWTEVVSTDPKPVAEGDAICVQHVLTEVKPNYWVKTV